MSEVGLYIRKFKMNISIAHNYHINDANLFYIEIDLVKETRNKHSTVSVVNSRNAVLV